MNTPRKHRSAALNGPLILSPERRLAVPLGLRTVEHQRQVVVQLVEPPCDLVEPVMPDFDVIFVGAGHNALVAAAYLAKAGREVCLLDQGDRGGVRPQRGADAARVRARHVLGAVPQLCGQARFR
ncbi:NAD(P)-binding protein [Actinocrispum sp. NPDC049592]|uniref:NAD(P)-binding protein n=1 Tax=Actinocrispum sp. NPDC049592 TaxID=3154835 RepID=UPI00341BB4D7